MITALSQTLADILAGGTSLTSTEQIDFAHPGERRLINGGSGLNVYFYDLRESTQVQHSGRQVEHRLTEGRPSAFVGNLPMWFDASFVISAWDRTTLGEHHLFTEALALLLRHRQLREDLLVPTLRGFGNLNMTVCAVRHIDVGALWLALGTPLRPSILVTITAPIVPQAAAPVPVVWERITRMRNAELEDGPIEATRNRRVSVAGIIKSASTTLPLAAARVGIAGTEKAATSNQEGLFYFDNLSLGHYVLELQCPGYTPQKCNVLVDSQNYTFKEILLNPK
jgi:Pvc16 N-terminal domain/CarboxypepD_reg-like domain